MALIHTPIIGANWFPDGIWFQRHGKHKAVVTRIRTRQGARYVLRLYEFWPGQYQDVPKMLTESMHRTLAYAKLTAFHRLAELGV
jgi:hypothetical protein